MRIPVETLQLSHIRTHPVWEFVDNVDTAIRPVNKIPVDSSHGKLIGVEVKLANGRMNWAIIGNLDSSSQRNNRHFLTLSLERNGTWWTWFDLARYHDFNYARNGPVQLAQFLELPVKEIFPIAYDVSSYVRGDRRATAGQVFQDPPERLNKSQIIELSLER